MEILTLLRLNGKRLAALLIVGAITGAIAAAVVAQRPANFEATTTVFVSQALPGDGTSFDVGPLVSDFQQAVTLPEVRQTVAEKLRLPASEVEVVVNRNGVDGGSVEVTATAPNARDAEAISQTVSTEGMRFLARREVSKAANIERLRTDEVEAAEKKRTDLLAANNAVDPMVSYQTKLGYLLELQQAIADGRVPYTEQQKLQIDAQAAQLRQQLPALEQAADEFEKVQKELENAEVQRETARLNLTAANEVLAAATTDVAISAGETVETSNVAAIMQAFAAAVVAVLVVGVAFFALADSSRRRPVRALPSDEADDAAATPTTPRGRALADTVLPAAYRPSKLEAMEAALESEGQIRAEPVPVRAAAATPTATVPVSARTGGSVGSASGGTGSVTGSGSTAATARSTSTAPTTSPTIAASASTSSPSSAPSSSATATPATATPASVSPASATASSSSSAKLGPASTATSRIGSGASGSPTAGSTAGVAADGSNVARAGRGTATSAVESDTVAPESASAARERSVISGAANGPGRSGGGSAAKPTNRVADKNTTTASDEVNGEAPAGEEADVEDALDAPAAAASRPAGPEDRKPNVGAAERPRRARRPEAQSMFARPAETTTVAAVPDEADSEPAPVNAEARQRRSAANRRRLGS